MDFRKKKYPHYYHKGMLVSAKDKHSLNLQMIQKLKSLLDNLREKKTCTNVLVQFEIFCSLNTCHS